MAQRKLRESLGNHMHTVPPSSHSARCLLGDCSEEAFIEEVQTLQQVGILRLHLGHRRATQRQLPWAASSGAARQRAAVVVSDAANAVAFTALATLKVRAV